MRVEIGLVFNIIDIQNRCIMLDKSDGHDNTNVFVAVVLYGLEDVFLKHSDSYHALVDLANDEVLMPIIV